MGSGCGGGAVGMRTRCRGGAIKVRMHHARHVCAPTVGTRARWLRNLHEVDIDQEVERAAKRELEIRVAQPAGGHHVGPLGAVAPAAEQQRGALPRRVRASTQCPVAAIILSRARGP